MKKFLTAILFFITFLSSGLIAVKAESAETISQERYDRVCRWGILNPPECKKQIIKKRTVDTPNQSTSSKENTKKIKYDKDCRWGIFNPPKCKGRDSRYKNNEKILVKKTNNRNISNTGNNDISFYTGTFDLIDKEGDDQTNLFGLEHKNPNLSRNTILGKFSPVSGGFMTGKSSAYLYTGIEGQYGFGPVKILPSFTPGYYRKGDGKDLGSALEFKSEIKVGLDILESSKLSYSYSHISNNEWGDSNPGTDNQQITFSKNF
jgi:hypothetical protein